MKHNIEYDADTIWAASVAAFRLNGDRYVKTADGGQTNIHLLKDIIKENFKDVSDQDREVSIKVRQYYQNKVMEMLTNKTNHFLERVISLAQKEKFTDAELRGSCALIAYSPKFYEECTKNDAADEKTFYSQHQGTIGEKLVRDVEIIRQTVSDKWRCYFISAIDDGNKYFFATSKPALFNVGDKVKIQGTVKAHRDDFVTQLNRVKLLNKFNA